MAVARACVQRPHTRAQMPAAPLGPPPTLARALPLFAQVVEFVDRTHKNAVNQNEDFRAWCAVNEHAYHTPTGELTKWMDNAFLSKMKVPFYGKHPYEMNK